MPDATQIIIQSRDDVQLVADIWDAPSEAALLLLPCGGEVRDVWHEVARHLALDTRAHWRIVAPDYRGHGDSGRTARYVFADFLSDLQCWIAYLGARRLVVVGGSIGGALGMVAAGEGASIDGLVLLDVPTVPVLEGATLEAAKVSEALRRGFITPETVDPAFIASGFVQDVFRDPDRWARAAVRLRIPTLLIAGARGVIGPTQVTQYREHVPHGELAMVQSGHLVARKAPVETAGLLSSFLRSHWPVRGAEQLAATHTAQLHVPTKLTGD